MPHRVPRQSKEHTLRPVDYASLDARIRGLVRSLRHAGFQTISSCQGGEGHEFERPTVRLEYRKARTYLPRIIAHMQHLGIPCTVSGPHVPVQIGRIHHEDRYFQVELWSARQLEICPPFPAEPLAWTDAHGDEIELGADPGRKP